MSDESQGRSAARRYAITAGKLVVSVALLVFLFKQVDTAKLWETAKHASIPWLLAGLVVLTINALASVWRWRLLLQAQHVAIRVRTLIGSLLVANFFNNFLPSNVGGDVIRIRDTAGPAKSKTVATTVVLVDRGFGVMALVLISAFGATMSVGLHGAGAVPILPSWLWAVFFLGVAVSGPMMYAPEGVGRLLQPLTVVHPEWIGGRIDTFTVALARFRDRPSALFACFGGAVFVQGLLVLFYLTVVHALNIPISAWDLAVIVPLSLVVQMAPISVNGFGVREGTFALYFASLHQPKESAVALSLVAAVMTMIFSLSGAAVYVSRGH